MTNDLATLRAWAERMATDPQANVTPPERALWGQIADEVAAYLDSGDGQPIFVSSDQGALFGGGA